MIDNKFLYFQTKDRFRELLFAERVDRGSIAFIEDQGVIWTHGKEYVTAEPLSFEDIDDICT